MALKRKGEGAGLFQDQDPDYQTVSVMTASKRQRLFEKDAKDSTVKKIDGIIRRQFVIEMKHKEKEVELIDERIHQVRVMLDKLRACIVANYYGSIGLGHSSSKGEKVRSAKFNLNHPAIQRALNSHLKAALPPATPDPATEELGAAAGSLAEAASTPSSSGGGGLWSSQQSERSSPESEQLSRADPMEVEEESGATAGAKGPRNSGPDTFGVGPALMTPKPPLSQVDPDEGSRFHVKKRIIVGNVSKYIPPENREDSDPSTHKWMVYVRGPTKEPRIDHFVKRIWFFLHPSYRPNDLVEVKEPPFHLTRRGWGEFPIRIQLHFLDPRNKKVDIIHPLKLDRTYTGLQTLGAETIVDVELDRYLFDDHGQPLSRPMTPTITKVNYQEGIKPGSPGTAWDEARWRGTSPRIKELGKETAAVASLAVSDRPQEEAGAGLAQRPEETPPRASAARGAEPRTVRSLSEGAVPAIPSQSFSGIIGPSGIQPSIPGHQTAASAGQIAVQQRQGGQFVRVMPPLGPIRKSPISKPSAPLTKGQTPLAAPATVVTPTEERGGSVFGSPPSSVQTLSAGVPPALAGGINVAEAAAAAAGKGTFDVRIQEGKVVQEVTLPSQDLAPGSAQDPATEAAVRAHDPTPNVVAQIKTEAGVEAPPGVLPTPLRSSAVLQTTAPSRVQNVQGALVTTGLQKLPQTVGGGGGGSILGAVSQAGGIVVQPTSSQLSRPVMSTLPSGSGVSLPAVKGTIPSTGSIAVIPSRSPTEASKHSPATATATAAAALASGIPSAPPGTQYYITAKSTDPNLQGKVILIPQQVFQQASSQQGAAGGKHAVGKAPGSAVGKVGAAKSTAITAAASSSSTSKSPFLSPSNVLILPAGSIVPPLPPGSIVQIQQVPSPVRSTSASSSQTKAHPTAALTKAIATPGKSAAGAKVTGLPSGGVIQIQRTPGTGIAKVSGVQGVSQSAGISILPEQKGAQLAKTPSGGVVFVQRTPAGGKIAGGQTLARLPLVQGGLALPQKITLATQLPPGAVPLPQGSLTLKPGSSVNIVQSPTQKTLQQQGQTLVLHTQPSSVPKVQGKPVQTVTAIRQPAGPGQTSKFIIQGQGSKLLTPGQLQVRLNAAPGSTSVAAAARPITASPVCTPAADPSSVVIAQIPSEGKPGSTAAVLAAQGSKRAEAGMQEPDEPPAMASESMPKGVDPGQGLPTRDTSRIQVLPAEESVRDALVREKSKEVPKGETTSARDPGAVALGVSDASPGYPEQLVPAKGPSALPGLARPQPKLVIKQEPGSSPLKTRPATTLATPPHPNDDNDPSASSADAHVTVETADDVEVSALMRELAVSCQEGLVSVYGLETMEELISAIVKKTPLISKDRVQSEHPFSATSLEHYRSWSGPKRRAAEWHRAVSVRRIANESRERSARLGAQRLWTTKEVMVWCRQRGYTPPEPDIVEKEAPWCNICGELKENRSEKPPGAEEHNCRIQWLSSNGLLKPTTYTIPDGIADSVREQQAAIEKNFTDSDAEIDVVGVWNPNSRAGIKRELVEGQAGPRCYLPLSEGARAVQEVAQEIGVSFKPTQLAPDTFASVTEEVLFSATSQFLSTLLRESMSQAYKERTDNRIPKEILPVNVMQAINSVKTFDFLSNAHLGVLATPIEDNQ